MGQTSGFKLPWPEINDDADGSGDVKRLAERAEAILVSGSMLAWTPSWTSLGTVQPSGVSSRVGRYSVDRGVCFFSLFIGFSSAVVGGRGELRLGLPLPARSDLGDQNVRAKTYIPGFASYQGMGVITSDNPTVVRCVFPIDATTSKTDYWRNADSTGAPGTGVPVASSGNVTVRSGGNIVVGGHYFVQT